MRFLAFAALAGGLFLSSVSAQAFCFKGVSRTITVGPSSGMNSSNGQFLAPSVLRDREVVLTFDDGPFPGRTDKVLDTLAENCVKATFFVVGSMARSHSGLLRRIKADGHTVGVHTHSHANLAELETPAAVRDIRLGYGAVQSVLGARAAAPFFRFPYLAQTSGLRRYLADKGVTVFDKTQLAMGDDWLEIGPDDVLNRVMTGLSANGKGVVLLHDTKLVTVKVVPKLLSSLKAQGYKIVHLVPSARVATDLALKVTPGNLPKAEEPEEIATLSADDDFSAQFFIENVK